MAVLDEISGVEAIQLHLETLAAKHKTRGSYKNFLQPRHLKDEFKPREKDSDAQIIDDETADELFDDFARVVCKANAIPRKELFEAWAMALYVHNHFSSDQSRRIADLACGHGLLSWALMYLDDLAGRKQSVSTSKSSSSCIKPRSAICIDLKMPMSVEKLETAMTKEWPNFHGRWDYVEGALERVVSAPSTLLVGIHCCGTLSDKVLDLAVASNAPLALVPCCHTRKCLSRETNRNLNAILKEQCMTLAEFIDGNRIQRLRDAGYTVHEERIPQVITPKNRIILATPPTKEEGKEIAPLLTDMAYSQAIRKFKIPVGDSVEARAEVDSLAGRAAAMRRRRKLPPSLSISVILPHPKALTIQDVEELSKAVAKDYKMYCDDDENNDVCNDTTISTSVDIVGVLHPRDDGNYCQTFRVTYQVEDESGTIPEVTKKQAIKMTVAICHKIDSDFEEGVVVRQVPGEKNFRKENPRLQGHQYVETKPKLSKAKKLCWGKIHIVEEHARISGLYSSPPLLCMFTIILLTTLHCIGIAALQPSHQIFTVGVSLTKSSLHAKRGRPKKSQDSWATSSIQDSRRAQEILRSRSVRGKPRIISEELPEEQLGNPVSSITKLSTNSKKSKIKNSRINLTRKSRKKEGSLQSGSSKSVSETDNSSAVYSNGVDFPYEVTLEALKTYYSENENLSLPRRFIVPESEAYPSIWHGVDLAGTVYNMRWWQMHVKQRPERVSQLNQLGFVWERLQPEWNLILEALIVYRGMYGDLLVPANFTVPFKDSNWPKACWGIALGSVVFKIRNRSDHLRDVNTAWKRRDQLERIGFIWDVQELRFKKFCSALKLYAKIEQGDEMSLEKQLQKHASASPQLFALKIPTKFVVPRSSRWPNEFWGYRLGERCTQVRQKQLYVKGHPSRLKILADLGFYMSSGNDSLKWLKVVHAAALYSQMHSNCLDVPTKFVVPAPPHLSEECDIDDNDTTRVGDGSCIVGSDDAWPWPEYLWGFPLGQRLRDIRVKGYFLRGDQANIRRRQLEALGFNWEPKRGRPKKLPAKRL